MADEFEERCVRRFCDKCGHHAKQMERLRVENDPMAGRSVCIDAYTICPKCGEKKFCEMEIVSDHPSRQPMKNSQKCRHCGEVVWYKFKVGDEVAKCPKCGGEIIVSTSFAMPDKPIDEFSDEELDSYGIVTGPTFIAAPPTDMIFSAFNWDIVLGYGIRPNDVVRDLRDENDHPGPYSWDLACKISKIAKLGDSINNHPLVSKQLFEEWFYNVFGCLIKNEKMQGIKRPDPPRPKGFWESLFG